MLWLVLLAGLIVISLIYAEYRDHDRSGHYVSPNTPNPDDDPLLSMDKIQKMLEENTEFVSWRLAMLIGIVAALPIVYFIERRLPTPFEWGVVGGLIFIAAYMSYSWIWARYLNPTHIGINRSLIKTRDKVHRLIIENVEHELDDLFVSDLPGDEAEPGIVPDTYYDPNYNPNYNPNYDPIYSGGVYEPSFMDVNN